MKKILITGKNGQLGIELQAALAAFGNIYAYDKQECDLSNADSIIKIVRQEKPDIIINAGAYTAVDKAETDRTLAMAINGAGPGILAEEAKRSGAFLIHYSTDYVFNGKKKAPYEEDDVPDPLNYYGETKLAGERAIMAANCRHVILRTSWVYGMHGNNFLLTMIKLAKERRQLKIVHDQLGAPTWSRTIARATAKILYSMDSDTNGIYHLSAAGQTNWHDFAQAIFKIAYREQKEHIPEIIGISANDYITAAKRPANSLLSHKKLQEHFQLHLDHWEKALNECLTAH